METSNKTYPEYMDELLGMASAAGLPFHTLAVLNLRNEIRQTTSFGHGDRFDHCSDYLVWNRPDSPSPPRAYLIHNEDGAPYSRNRAFLLRAELFPLINTTAYVVEATAGAGRRRCSRIGTALLRALLPEKTPSVTLSSR